MTTVLHSLLSSFIFITFLRISDGCNVDTIDNWFLPVNATILDTHRGVILNLGTSDVEDVTVTITEGLNAGPYITVDLVNSNLVVSTNNNFPNYEEVETAQNMNFVVNFVCTGGSTRFLVFTIYITDTNNNDPQFIPSNNFEFTIAPPVPPGFLITDCVNDLIVRDIDLTTKRIDFEIEGSSLFEISYDESSTVPKEFKAILRTTTFIRSIAEPIILTIKATDVDETGDPPRTTTGTVRILGDNEFELPSEPIFSQTFYLATYSTEQGISLQDTIYLRQGYDNGVKFNFEGEHSQYFEIVIGDNQVSFTANAIPTELFGERQLYLIVKAEREYTSGATATVIVQLPEAVLPEGLTHITFTLHAGRATSILVLDVVTPAIESFDKLLYNGKLENGVLSHDAITLSGFTGLNIELTGEYASLFESSISNGLVTVVPRASAIFPESLTHMTLALQAGRANSVLILEVIIPAPASFDKVLYRGKLEDGVVSHDIISISEFTGSNIELLGEYSSSFESSFTNGEVLVVHRTSGNLPEGLTHVPLTLLAGPASSVLLLEVISSGSEIEVRPTFDKVLYNGKIEEGIISHEQITLREFNGSNIEITGDYASSFESSLLNGLVSIKIRESAIFPKDLTHIAIILEAGPANSVLLLEIISSETEPLENFDKVLYNGKIEDNTVSHETITLSEYSGSSVLLSGDYASLFESNLSNGLVTVTIRAGAILPLDITHVALTLEAGRANSVLLLEINPSDSTRVEYFDKVLYIGKIEDNIISHEIITLSEFSGTSVLLFGEYAPLFESLLTNDVVSVTIRASAVLPLDVTHIALTLQAGRANSVLLLEVNPSGSATVEYFDKILYNGKIEENAVSHEIITLSEYTGTNVVLSGEFASSFESSLSNSVVSVTIRASTVLPTNLTHITLTLQAGRANSVLLLEVINSDAEIVEYFDKVLYNGKIEDNNISHEIITLSEYTGVDIILSGDFASSFESSLSNEVVSVKIRPSAVLPADLTHTALMLQAGRANSVLLLEIIYSDSEKVEYFDKVLYTGKIEDNSISHEIITLSEYTGTEILLSGEYSSLFEPSLSNNVVSVTIRASAVLPTDVTYIALTLQAGRANSVLLLEIISSGSEPEIIESFDKVLYEGHLKDGLVTHETISLTAYNGSNILLSGDYATSFEASISNGVVSVEASSSAVFPIELTHTALTLQAQRARAVLLLDVSISETVTFSSSSYYLWADVNQTGIVGRVQATANTGETIEYALRVDDDLLQGRVSINNEGEISLLTEAQVGVYSFTVTATARNSQAYATATVLLRIEELPQCNIEDRGLPQLIVLERLEEEEHRNLVILNKTEFENCHYTLANGWPEVQSWLYVDEDGLHTRSIDREDESIAFMTLSQIQVELTLICDSDETPVSFSDRRSSNSDGMEVASDSYGSNRWVLADTIVYNPRRSFVNLIVIDINDNAPIFIGKEIEPIYVGYPVAELEDIVLPRALAELKATDADIGENAALVYWSPEEVLAVSPRTGLVHVRNNARLENNSRLTIYATDQNGNGLNGTLDIIVRLLDRNQIAVVTVQNAFLEDENNVLNKLSDSVGYEIKILRSVVISEGDENVSRKKRNTVSTSSNASLQLYVYGIFESEPVDVTRLTSDIENTVTVNIARILSLEDHLENIEICLVPGRDIGLLVATIVLAVLLFVLIIAIALWFFLKWRKTQNYEKFSDRNSLASRDNAAAEFPKVENISTPMPRLNIEDLRRSEKKLQERLEIPTQEVRIESDNNVDELRRGEKKLPERLQVPIQTVRMEPQNNEIVEVESRPRETIVSFSTPEMPIVIQSIDKLKDNSDESEDDDEFGENNQKPRKSVVTFNENVEKIIHLEDGIEDSPEPNLEVYKF